MRRFAQLGAVVASASLTISGLAAVAPPAQAVPAPDPIGVNTGAAWLSGQLTNGLFHYPDTGFGEYDDVGLSIDAAFALAEVGGQASSVSAITSAVAANIAGYNAFGAGSSAKAAVLAESQGQNAANFGGSNLVQLVENATSATAPIVGRLEEISGASDFANTIKQAFAARALADAGSGEAEESLDFLLDQQCPNGGFRLSFTASKTAPGQSCTDNTQAQLDVTSIAILQLVAMGSSATEVTAAKNWLISKQRTDGAWGGDPGGSAANANSTGLAAWALGDTADSAQGATWLRDHQASRYDDCTKLKPSIGAVAYDDAGLSGGRSNGITNASLDQFRRATAQALPALEYLDSETVNQTLGITGPSGYLKAGSSPTFQVTGGVNGEELCLTSLGSLSGSTVATTPWTRSLYMQSGSITRSVVARDRNGHTASLPVKVLSPKRIGASTTKYRFKRRSFARIYVYGLALNEQVKIYFRGQLKATGTSDPYGRFIRGIWTGRKLGKGTVRVYGQFGDIRKGTKKIKVVR